jgi:hypothetical protein
MTGQVPEEPGGEAGREIERLLGPARPELGCDECFERLDEYVELELTGAGTAGADAAIPAMRPHLMGCPACREDHDSLLAFLLADPADGRLGHRVGLNLGRQAWRPAGMRRAGEPAR